MGGKRLDSVGGRLIRVEVAWCWRWRLLSRVDGEEGEEVSCSLGC